jgi:hypothetical protein
VLVVVKIKRKRGMINPTDFDESVVGDATNKASDIFGGIAETISDKAKLYGATHGSDKTKPTDFDENPPKSFSDKVKETTSSIADRVSDELDKEPQTPYPPEATIEPQLNPSSTTWSSSGGQSEGGSRRRNIPDDELPSVIIPDSGTNPDGSINADYNFKDDTFKDKTKKFISDIGDKLKGKRNETIQMPGTGNEDNLLKFNISDSELDRLASLCGNTKSIKILRQEYYELREQKKTLESMSGLSESQKRIDNREMERLRKEYDEADAVVTSLQFSISKPTDEAQKANLQDQMKGAIAARSRARSDKG